MSDTALVVGKPSFSLTPRTLDEAMAFAKLIAESDLAPKDYRSKPGNVLVAVQMGAEVGLSPMQAIQNIAVINGRPALWGDGMLAVVQASPVYEGHRETFTGDGEILCATCAVKRRGQDWITKTFSVADAKRAGLWGKQGPWQSYPQRMLQMRARGFALRDVFSDVLRGLSMVEEAEDIPTEPVLAAPPVAAIAPPQRKALPVVETADATLSDDQQHALGERAKARGWSKETYAAFLHTLGVAHPREIKVAEFEDILAALDEGPRS